MSIFGPLVAPRTSTVTDAFCSASAPAVTLSPSTSITTGRLTDSPTSWAILSISMTSPTATFCCWPPLRTIAYTADSLSSPDDEVGTGWGCGPACSPVDRTWPREPCTAHAHRRPKAPRVESTDAVPAGQNVRRSGQRRRDPFFLIGTWKLLPLPSVDAA